MAFCSNCGESVGENDKFCGSCGTPVQATPTVSGGDVASQAQEKDDMNDAPGVAPNLTTPLEIPKKGVKLDLVRDVPKKTVSLAKDMGSKTADSSLKLGAAPKLTSVLKPQPDVPSAPRADQSIAGAPAPFGSGSKKTEVTVKSSAGGALPVFGVGASASALVDEEASDSMSGPFSEAPAKANAQSKSSSPDSKVSLAKDPVEAAVPVKAPTSAVTPARGDYSANRSAGISQSVASGDIKTYLIFSIFTTMCCCTPAGIAALVCSILCDSRLKHGDLTGARDMSTWSYRVNIAGVILGVLGGICYIILMALGEMLDD